MITIEVIHLLCPENLVWAFFLEVSHIISPPSLSPLISFLASGDHARAKTQPALP